MGRRKGKKLIDTFKEVATNIAFLDRGWGIKAPDVQSAIEEVKRHRGEGRYSVKIGDNAKSLGESSVSIGTNAKILDENATKAIAIGDSAEASGENTIHIGGAGGGALTKDGISIGKGTSSGEGAISISPSTAGGSYGKDSISIGDETASGKNAIKIGSGGAVYNDEAISIGLGGATAPRSLSLGSGGAYGPDAITIGRGDSNSANSLNIGEGQANAPNSLNIGAGMANNQNTIQIGSGYANSKGTINIGSGQANVDNALNVGNEGGAFGPNALNIGGGSAFGMNALNVGPGQAEGTNSVSVGGYVAGNESSTVGNNKVYGEKSVAIGSSLEIGDIATPINNAVAIGSGAIVHNDNQGVLGGPVSNPNATSDWVIPGTLRLPNFSMDGTENLETPIVPNLGAIMFLLRKTNYFVSPSNNVILEDNSPKIIRKSDPPATFEFPVQYQGVYLVTIEALVTGGTANLNVSNAFDIGAETQTQEVNMPSYLNYHFHVDTFINDKIVIETDMSNMGVNQELKINSIKISGTLNRIPSTISKTIIEGTDKVVTPSDEIIMQSLEEQSNTAHLDRAFRVHHPGRYRIKFDVKCSFGQTDVSIWHDAAERASQPNVFVVTENHDWKTINRDIYFPPSANVQIRLIPGNQTGTVYMRNLRICGSVGAPSTRIIL